MLPKVEMSGDDANSTAIDRTKNFNVADSTWKASDLQVVQAQYTGDRQNPREKTLNLQYGDMDFDRKLAQGGNHTLQITGMPTGVRIATWADDRGFYFSFTNGKDYSTPHYIPRDLKTIAAYPARPTSSDDKGGRRDVDEMRAETYLAMTVPDGQFTMPRVNGQSQPLGYAFGISNMSIDLLDRMQGSLRRGAQADPTNPYFPMMLGDLLVADAMRPIREQVLGGANTINLDNGITMSKLQAATEAIGVAQRTARDSGDPWLLMQANQRAALLSFLPGALRAAGPLDIPPANITGRSTADPFEVPPRRNNPPIPPFKYPSILTQPF